MTKVGYRHVINAGCTSERDIDSPVHIQSYVDQCCHLVNVTVMNHGSLSLSDLR